MPSLVLRGGRVLAASASAALVLAGLTLTANGAAAAAAAVCTDNNLQPGTTVSGDLITVVVIGDAQTVTLPGGDAVVNIDACGSQGSFGGGLGGEVSGTFDVTGVAALTVVAGRDDSFGGGGRTGGDARGFGGGYAGVFTGSVPSAANAV